MAVNSRQPRWDILESVVLLDGYLEIQQRMQPRARIIKRVSADLRKMAINRGAKIDDIYRNENGISYQMQSMDSAYKGEEIYVPATKLFAETVELYRTNPEGYRKILEEAKHLIAVQKTNKAEFLEWASSSLPEKRNKWIEVNILKMESFAVASKTITGSIFEITDIELLEKIIKASEKNKVFQIKNRKLIKNIYEDFRIYIKYCRLIKDSKCSDKGVQEIGDRQIVDFSNEVFLAYLQPKSVTIFGCEKRAVSSWKDVYLCVITELYKRIPDAFKDLKTLPGFTRLEFGCELETLYMTSPQKINDDLYIETELSAADIVKRIKILLFLCGVGSEVLKISYQKSTSDSSTDTQTLQNSDFTTSEEKICPYLCAVPKLSDVTNAKNSSSTQGTVDTGQQDSVRAIPDIVPVLKKYYEYGFKVDSLIELMRFRQFAEEMNIVLNIDDVSLKNLILSSGTLIDGRVYYKNANLSEELQSAIARIYSEGTNVIFYERLFENESEMMEMHVITSPEMLKEYLQKNIIGWSFSKRFMMKGEKRTEKEAVSDEIKRVWGEYPTERVNTLSNRLPYIPLDNIWRVISGNDAFVLAAEGEYLLVDRFKITEDEETEIVEFVERNCEQIGYASISDVPLGTIEEENYELPRLVIYNAIYKKVLIGRYHMHSKILTKDDSGLDAVQVLKQSIANKDESTVDELLLRVKEITGTLNRSYAFQALYDDMVRVDRNRFVANRFVHFPVDEIDTALSNFVQEGFCAVRDITTFALFPMCGQPWSHYLLESFCYKYSRKYSLHVIHFNDKNAGIIAEKEFNKTYNQMLAMALSRTEMELNPNIAGKYLFDTGYMSKSKYSRLDDIVQQAMELRKER